MAVMQARLLRGRGVASGRGGDPRYPDGTLALQAPLFARLGVDLQRFRRGTLNLSVAPFHVRVATPDVTLRQIAWSPHVPPEDFSFVRCRVGRPGAGEHEALVYWPHPDTTPEHHQPPTVVEVLAPDLGDVAAGEAVALTYDPQKLRVTIPPLWLVRAKVRGRSRVGAWMADGYCAVGWREVGPVEAGTPRPILRARLERAFPGRADGTYAAWAGNLDRFVTRMGIGDAVVTPDGARLHVGTVMSSARFVAGTDEAHRRAVAWLAPHAPLARAELSGRARAALTTMLTVADLSPHAEEVVGAP